MRRLAIQNLLKCTRMLQIFIDQHPIQIGILYIYIRHRVKIVIYLQNCLHTDRCERLYI